MKRVTQKGFSLVELSIVLVILGLLVGGILAGQSLIRASELRNVTLEADKLVSGMHTFRDKYFFYPGDMPNAASVWGAAGGNGTGNDAACRTAALALAPGDRRTCNGDGDKTINLSGGNGSETVLIWQHLANAGLLEGAYAYRSTSIPGESIPPTRLDAKAGWFVGHNGVVAGSANVFNSHMGNGMNLFQRPTVYGVLTGAEAWNIDTKSDDGRPGTGRVISNWSATYSQAATACTTATIGSDTATALYQLDKSSRDCGLFWLRVL